MILFFVGIVLFIALLNMFNGGHDLVVLSLFVFIMAGGLRLWTRFSHSKVRCSTMLDKKRVFAGEDMALTINAENGKALPVWLQVEAPVNGPSQTPLCDVPLLAQRSLLWYQMTKFRWKFVAGHRGVHTIGPLRMSSGDLFGFFVKEQEIGEAIEVIVYPKLVPIGSLVLPKRDFFGAPGGESPVNDPVYILGTADYHHGRPAKHIHWKASARHHRLQEKIFESTEQEKILFIIDVDQFTDAHAEAFERCLEVAASLAVKFDRRGCAVGLITNGAMAGGAATFVPVARSSRQVPAILEALARLEMRPRGTLIDMLRHAVEIPWGTNCVLMTLSDDETAHIVKEHCRRRKTSITVLTHEGTCLLRRDGYTAVDGSGHMGEPASREAQMV